MTSGTIAQPVHRAHHQLRVLAAATAATISLSVVGAFIAVSVHTWIQLHDGAAADPPEVLSDRKIPANPETAGSNASIVLDG